MLKKTAYIVLGLWALFFLGAFVWELRFSTIRGQAVSSDCDTNDLYAVAGSHDLFKKGLVPFQWVVKVRRDERFEMKSLPAGQLMEIHVLGSDMLKNYPVVRSTPFQGECVGALSAGPFVIPRFPPRRYTVEVRRQDYEALEKWGAENPDVGGALSGFVRCQGCEDKPIRVLAYQEDIRGELVRSQTPAAAARIQGEGRYRLQGIPAGRKAYVMAVAELDEENRQFRTGYYTLNPASIGTVERRDVDILVTVDLGGGKSSSEEEKKEKSATDGSKEEESEAADQPELEDPVFEIATAEVGIDFQHSTRARVAYMPEGMSAGACVLDFNDDGRDDLYFVNTGPEKPAKGPPPVGRLYLNLGGKFRDVTDRMGDNAGGWGMGCAVGDFDNDGYQDLYVTRLGPNVLLQNQGDGTFRDATRTSGTGDEGFGASAAFLDYDMDGDLDLYAVNYVNFSFETGSVTPEEMENRGTKALNTMLPLMYAGEPNVLYRNQGAGVFADATRAAGVGDNEDGQSKSLGTLAADLNEDGWPDLYVANDTTPNSYFLNQRNGTFRDAAPWAGLADNRAGMGIASGDVNRDGRLDLFLGHFYNEAAGFYIQREDGTFADRAEPLGVAESSIPAVSFGTFFFDMENDGDLDLFVANGHVASDEAAGTAGGFTPLIGLQNQLYRQEKDGRFRPASKEGGVGFYFHNVARGAVAADFDGDGDLDVATSNNNGPAVYYRNRHGARSNWIAFRLEGFESARDALGAKVTLRSGDLVQTAFVTSGGSYCSQGGFAAHFGLGKRLRADEARIVWPSRKITVVKNPRINQVHAVSEQGLE